MIARAFTCYLEDQAGNWRVKDYERDLLRSIINVNDSLVSVGEGSLLASRGAAIMGLHFLDLNCEERRGVLERPWSWNWDNKRSSTMWYPEEDDYFLEGILNMSPKLEGTS
jgi:hypothetical protein